MGARLSIPKPHFIRLNIVFIYLLILITGGWLSYSVFNSGESIKSVNQKLSSSQLPSLTQISELRHWVNEYERVLYEFYATVERESVYQKLTLADQRIENNLRLLQISFYDNSDLKAVEHIYRKMQGHAQTLDEVLPPVPNDWDLARKELLSISQLGRETLPLLSRLSEEIKSQIEISKDRSSKQLEAMSIWVSAFSSLILLIAILVGYYVRRAAMQSKEKSRLSLFIENNPNPIVCIGFGHDIEFENTAWLQQYPESSRQRLLDKINSQLTQLEQKNTEFAVVNIQDTTQFLELSIHKIGKFKQFMVYIENITEREVARRELEFFAYNDPLTGLPNLKRLEEDLTSVIAKGNEYPCCLFSIGVKRLQLITTTHGHAVSDALIKAVAMRLQNCLVEFMAQFEVCRVYRFTGAKFDILLAGSKQDVSVDDAVFVLSEIIRQSFQKALNTSFGQFFLSVQGGCSLFPDHGYSADALIKNASVALNDAHKNNMEAINLFNHELAYRERNWFRLENDMRQANFSESFFLTYQPKLRLKDNRLVGMEALVRWEHPEKGLISPAEFIPIAEESGMILELGRWVLDTAIKQTSEWIKNGASEIQIAVNVSPSQLLSANFSQTLLASLKRYQLAAHHLEIEITEEVMVEDHALCVRILEELKSAGISIAIDDFGTGYSSLAYLNQFPLSKLKIDRSFVTDIHRNEGNYAIVRTIIALSQSLNFTVIAEGVESQEELEVLGKLGCHQGQGYLFSKPLTDLEFSRMYLSSNSLSHKI